MGNWKTILQNLDYRTSLQRQELYRERDAPTPVISTNSRSAGILPAS
ncbi:hypothetical protein PJF56_06005 [Roseofilum sp. BLCC_M91]|uniref:Uncharacterized protein n=1 Tax=Roseofilum halophilum BLCC-M91 TaxID=3022259 RepID=A0ABT7BGV2_9CYAN|nr:hypothetical protein [Roseofilum halophilum]MDJ1178410.1 hypothetical protein [Roseofilum halophilum BLCC-M91]